jgi:hypothetical protein
MPSDTGQVAKTQVAKKRRSHHAFLAIISDRGAMKL